MTWLLENWFWILIFVLFIAIHLFGHGGHGGHQQGKDEKEKDNAQAQIENTSSGGHPH